jgi:hypothetical protein
MQSQRGVNAPEDVDESAFTAPLIRELSAGRLVRTLSANRVCIVEEDIEESTEKSVEETN